MFRCLQQNRLRVTFLEQQGAIEAIATIEAMRHNYVPMTAGTQALSEDIEANVIFGEGKETAINYAISNTFGFGGHNAVLAFKCWEE